MWCSTTQNNPLMSKAITFTQISQTINVHKHSYTSERTYWIAFRTHTPRYNYNAIYDLFHFHNVIGDTINVCHNLAHKYNSTCDTVHSLIFHSHVSLQSRRFLHKDGCIWSVRCSIMAISHSSVGLKHSFLPIILTQQSLTSASRSINTITRALFPLRKGALQVSLHANTMTIKAFLFLFYSFILEPMGTIPFHPAQTPSPLTTNPMSAAVMKKPRERIPTLIDGSE